MAARGNADIKSENINSGAVANLASDVQSVDLDEEQEDTNAHQAARVSHTKRKTLEEIKSLVREAEGSTVSFVIVGKSDQNCKPVIDLYRSCRRREKHAHGTAAL